MLVLSVFRYPGISRVFPVCSILYNYYYFLSTLHIITLLNYYYIIFILYDNYNYILLYYCVLIICSILLICRPNNVYIFLGLYPTCISIQIHKNCMRVLIVRSIILFYIIFRINLQYLDIINPYPFSR